MMNYITSKDEMNRRKRAFSKLLISFFLSVCLFMWETLISAPEFMGLFISFLAIVLVLLYALFERSFNKRADLRISLSGSELGMHFINNCEKYPLADIGKIQIKRTSKGSIREIRIGLSSADPVFINGLTDFEQFKDDLISRIKDVQIKNIREPIDFDHPLFYVFLGLSSGVSLAALFWIISLLSTTGLVAFQFSVACFVIAIGIYWVACKPIKGRYGKKHRLTDYVFGLSLIIIGLLILVYSYGLI